MHSTEEFSYKLSRGDHFTYVMIYYHADQRRELADLNVKKSVIGFFTDHFGLFFETYAGFLLLLLI